MNVLRGAAGPAVCALVAVGATACEPAGGGLSASAVAFTTDRTATSTLERLTFEVAWLTCTAETDGQTAAATASPGTGRARVDCEGETESGQDITLDGTVTEERDGTCVRGDMTARIDRKVVFEATMLGDCSAAASPSARPTRTAPGDGGSRPGPEPTVTVTVTETVTVTAVPAK
ncbi:hypothetical protein [Streptomyces sp. NPDC005805]|uniref:hypothetical protein n=1 Tax=Streptomyces sp. NPDC005805 TaxID=3157068 RepID=UPI0033F3C114